MNGRTMLSKAAKKKAKFSALVVNEGRMLSGLKKKLNLEIFNHEVLVFEIHGVFKQLKKNTTESSRILSPTNEEVNTLAGEKSRLRRILLLVIVMVVFEFELQKVDLCVGDVSLANMWALEIILI